MSEIKVTINEKVYQAKAGETILELARRHDIEIPTLCHDPRLEPYSSCYLCVVEVEKMRGLQPSCSTKVNNGMVVVTDNERVTKSRKTALDLLVSNHYASCIAPCKATCPAGVDVQGYISLIEKGLYHEAVALIKEVNPLPAICGRVCVRPCEAACNRNHLDEGAPVGIDYMKRFVSDYDLYASKHFTPEVAASTGKKVAVIGAGPGGLSAAYFLQQKGHQVDIFEANNHAGGWLRYGIPEYRLPNDLLDKEIATITELGVNIFLNKNLGGNLSYKEINENYDACILTIGSQRGTLLRAEGEEADGVYSGIDFLRNMEQTGQKYDFSGKTTVVVGGGNTAMDCCRTSVRCGAEKTYVVYRRTEKEMPANPIEIHESKLEGVEYLFLTNPVRVNADGDGKVKSMTCIKMELGEPDSSGRRRPVPIPDSEFDIEIDYILAAIGQKTDVNFIDDINKYAPNGELKINRWGDLDANSASLQTGIESVFAAGDGVTGPATIIEAVAQAGTASRSCHQFLMGEEIKGEPKEFLSKKSNFKKQEASDYLGRYEEQFRKEMPVLDANNRFNFDEVELGYTEEAALEEAKRCLECGCAAYYTCDLKKYSTEYSAEQQRFKGDFQSFEVDFSHPYIEIDSNKCILCSRCIRICRDVVGAGALGLVERGFDTYVAPAMGNSLTETDCESCGLCISACPTGAMSENVPFKPGPLELDSFETISNYGSAGEKLVMHHKNGYVMQVTGANGMANPKGNFSRQDKFGYHYLNDSTRIVKPLLKRNGKFETIEFEHAFDIIKERIGVVHANENAFYAGARLTNEEQYLVQKIARAAAKTNNIGSFHYMGRGPGYKSNSLANVPFEQLDGASKIYLFGTETNADNPVVAFAVNSLRNMKQVPVQLVSKHNDSIMASKVDAVETISSYYYFVKAVNHYLLSNGMENSLFIADNCEGFESYKAALLAEDFDDLVNKSGASCSGTILNFATDFNKENNAILIFSEKEVTGKTGLELFNLALITGKLGKTSSGLISLKEKNNSHGLFDMGVAPKLAVGSQYLNNENIIENLETKWQVERLSQNFNSKQYDLFIGGNLKNLFVFGEDPMGCAIERDLVHKSLANTDFLMVQDYFMTETAEMADLILPASFPQETGGSFTNTQRVIQNFAAGLSPKTMPLYQQLIKILGRFDLNGLGNLDDILMEAFSLFPQDADKQKFEFEFTATDSAERHFDYACDNLEKRFADEFNANLNL